MVAWPRSSAPRLSGSAKYASVTAATGSGSKPSRLSPSRSSGLPITAVPLTRPERVEGHRCPVPVRVADQARRQHAVVVAVSDQPPGKIAFTGGDQVAERVAGLPDQQVVAVVADGRGVAERVGEPARQEEVPPGVVKLGGRIVVVIGGIEDPARRQPPRLAVPEEAGRPERPASTRPPYRSATRLSVNAWR